MRSMLTVAMPVVAALTLGLATTAVFAQSGPVATACKDDIAKLCTGKGHGAAQTRTCLEAAKDKVSASCKTALDTTGPGKGGGQGKGKAN